MQKKTESFPLLRDAYAIIAGIPESRFDLCLWRSGGNTANECGTIACAGGWLAMHPKFHALGLQAGEDGMPRTKGARNYGALAEVLGIDRMDAQQLFCSATFHSSLNPPNADLLSDKERWLARVRNFLAKQPTPVAQ
ncbi:hypothetical protein QYH69_32325 [Paraburkholderia sp. SARCC-3016]|uniref:hypothetical protein n=1 Tax=Paraburkholderia sp. SARCC-3016 TaxID=3058611 RepID=UPI00280788D3|nr:hypothetical protein [Paraburkholderia sp. SARCC-3016]MDQ7981911.1 hypothetical protein [Paraburkholderia sp. SARCC-3016]